MSSSPDQQPASEQQADPLPAPAPVSPQPTSPRPAGPRLHPWTLAIGGVVVALVLQMCFIGSYTGALHDPHPRKALPFGIVAPEQVQAALIQQIDAAASGIIDPRSIDSSENLHRQIGERDVDGGLVIDANGATLILADAAGPFVSTVLTTFTQQIASAQNLQLVIEHESRVSGGDPRALTMVYLVFGWVFGGYFCATVLATLRGYSFLNRQMVLLRLLLLAGYAVCSGIAGAVLVGPVIGAIDGHFWSMMLAGTLVVFAVAVSTMAVQILLGLVGTVVVLIAFVMIGNPSAGGVAPLEFLPSFWRAIGPWLPNWAGFTLVRNLVYFDGNDINRALAVLAGYAIVGVVILLAWGPRPRAFAAFPSDPEAELATAAAAA